MKKKLLLASALVSLLGTTAQAQTPTAPNQKWDTAVERLFLKNQKMGVNAKSLDAPATGVIISTNDAEAVAEAISAKGYEATIIDERTICAKLPLDFIPQLAEMPEVNYINGARQMYSLMESTRIATNADKVQAGTGLETPFTGKGVIIGVIDQGFQYKHVAFLNKDKKTRVVALWDHYSNRRPTQTIPSSGDMIDGGHATHVTGIAAGSKIQENNYYGIAPDADIIMVPSRFENDDVLKEAKYIKDFANKEGKPFVINMSFGSHDGPHDGTSDYDIAMDGISQAGGILVAAMGNEGRDDIHGYHMFKEDNEKIYVIFEPGKYNSNVVELWGMQTDGKKHLSVKPVVYDKNRRSKDYKTTSFWNRCMQASSKISPNNKKEQFSYWVDNMSLQSGNSNLYFGLEITGNANEAFHLWVNPRGGSIYNAGNNGYVQGDSEYCVSEGGATISSAIAVAAYNGNDGTYISAIDGRKYSRGGNCKQKGAISDFSSHGPWLGKGDKPTIAAPGSVMISAFSRYGSGFDPQNTSIAGIVKNGYQKDYYSMMSGTSMATPVVTGIVALWLEANPELTSEQIKQILKETAIKDRYTGGQNVEWDKLAGYGKIDAYAGLKKVLEMAEHTGINDQLNSEAPVSIQKNAEQFKILFNNDESYATITLFNAKGIAVKREQLNDVRRGHETILNTIGLPAGVYIVNITTTASTTSKKFIVN